MEMKYARRLKNIQLSRDYSSVFTRLSDEDAGQLIKALFAALDGKTAELADPVTQGIFVGMATQIDAGACRFLRRKGEIDETSQI